MKNPLWRSFDEGSTGIRGWGVVRDNILCHKVIWAPVPLHLLFRYGERAYWWVAFRVGLKHRIDCPCCGERFDRFRWADEKEYVDRAGRLETSLYQAERTIRQLRKERARRPDPPKIPTPLREQRILMTLGSVAHYLRMDAEGLDDLSTKLDAYNEGDNQFRDLARRLRSAADVLKGQQIRTQELHTQVDRLKACAKDAMELYPETHVCFPGEPLP